MITATLEPVASGIIAYLYLNEHATNLQILGAMLVVAGIVLIQLRQEKDTLAPEIVRRDIKRQTFSGKDYA
jgi:drug/metabolite transporter (DMT)-like permease